MTTCDSSCQGSPQNELTLNRCLSQHVTAFEEDSDEGNGLISPKNANDSSSDAYARRISKKKDNAVMLPIHKCIRVTKLPMITAPIDSNETKKLYLSNSESSITTSIMKVKTLEESISGKNKRGDIRVGISETAVDFDTCHIREYERELGDNPSCSIMLPIHECVRIAKLPMITAPIDSNETKKLYLSNSESSITTSIMKVKTLEESISGKNKRGDIRVGISETAVDFDTCHIREYERELGDNPSCSSGAPVSLGWNFVEIGVFPFDEFEKSRDKNCDDMDKSVHGKRRAAIADTLLSRTEREKLLMDHGFTRGEIAQATKINVKIKNNRRQTVNNLKFQKAEEFIEAIRRYLKQAVKCRKKSVDVDKLLYEQRAAFASIKIQEEHDACVLDKS
eukprot:CAMPEP_0194444724 /NCGR_PEP_ID=MMETSP0176-20130528/127447_1 /TAXON_ID=216777 /ORGANISM="Proboscia alata, Strain PI-D3" /LENGTH=393 /DNA_ID=CAMNT_0039271169 /DNA_START=406 /DNA_END=1583 /DNA_ORIENTATION=+